MAAHDEYLDLVQERIDRIRETQVDALARAAAQCAESIGNGGATWVFGAGHSSMMAMESYPRIGGVLGFVPIVELGLLYFTNVVGSGGLEQTIYLERIPGYAEAILRSYQPRRGDTMIIYSGSGLEILPKEMATAAKARGLTVIGVTSLEYSREAAKRRGVERILADEVDILIDSGLPVGDAILPMEGIQYKVGPSSSIIHLSVMNSIIVDTAQQLLDAGTTPEVFHSPHLENDGYDAYKGALERFRKLVSRGPDTQP